MPPKRWAKKIVGVFISATILVNTIAPVFAHSQSNSESYTPEQPENIQVCISPETSDDKLMEIDLNGQKISSYLMGKDDDACSDKQPCSKQLSKDQTVQLDDVLSDVSVRYKMKEQKLKEDFILHSKEAQSSFVLQYNVGNLHAKQINTQDILLLDENGRAKMLISAPYMTDAAGAKSEAVSLQISGEKNGVLSVDLTADSSWLQDDKRNYPVEVDPLYSLPKDTLRKGDRNKDVAVLKSMLLEAGFGAGISYHEVMNDMRSELFGPITERFVRTFQEARGLDPTGVADIHTLEVLEKHLERKRILDTQEHIDQFLKRVESRSSPETGEQVRGVASYFKRVNFTDLAVTVGITGVATIVGVACFPLIGVAGVLAGGAAIGAVANGASEYAQQKAVGESVDMTRVGIKALGGAVKGGTSAIPGVRMANAFGKAVNVAGQTLRPVLSSAVGDAVGKAAVTAATNALTPTVVCHAVGAAGKVLASAAAGDTLMAAGSALAVGAAEDLGCAVQSGKSVKEAAKDAALNGAFQAASVPAAAAAVVGGAACCAVCVAANKKDPDPPKPNLEPKPTEPQPPLVPEDPQEKSDLVVIPSPPKPNLKLTQEHLQHSEEKPAKKMRHQEMSVEPTIPDYKVDRAAEVPKVTKSAAVAQESKITTGQLIKNTRTKTIEDSQEARRHYSLQQACDIEKKCYEKDLKVAAEIRKSVEDGTRKLTKEEEHRLEVFESTACQAIQDREKAQRGDMNARRMVENESRMTTKQIMAEQIRRYDEMIGKQFFDGLADIYT